MSLRDEVAKKQITIRETTSAYYLTKKSADEIIALVRKDERQKALDEVESERLRINTQISNGDSHTEDEKIMFIRGVNALARALNALRNVPVGTKEGDND